MPAISRQQGATTLASLVAGEPPRFAQPASIDARLARGQHRSVNPNDGESNTLAATSANDATTPIVRAIVAPTGTKTSTSIGPAKAIVASNGIPGVSRSR